MKAIVTATDLEKRFGDVVAVDGVSFEIAEGEIFGLLGPNGAGKTTTISMISCLLKPDAGEIDVAGHSVRRDSLAVRAVLGIVPQEIALYPTLTAAENLRFWARMYGLAGRELSEAVDYGLAIAGLEDKAKKRIETFSGGMKRRINIAAGVLHRPKVLLMDEPTVGIDPQSRNHILDTVRALNREGMTVLYTSHYMEEVETLCDRVGIVDHGTLIAHGTLEEVRSLAGDEDRIQVALGDGGASDNGAEDAAPTDPEVEAAAARIRTIPGVTRVEVRSGGVLDLSAPDGAAVLAGVVEGATRAGARVRAIEVVEPNLESVFLHLTGRGLRD